MILNGLFFSWWITRVCLVTNSFLEIEPQRWFCEWQVLSLLIIHMSYFWEQKNEHIWTDRYKFIIQNVQKWLENSHTCFYSKYCCQIRLILWVSDGTVFTISLVSLYFHYLYSLYTHFTETFTRFTETHSCKYNCIDILRPFQQQPPSRIHILQKVKNSMRLVAWRKARLQEDHSFFRKGLAD